MTEQSILIAGGYGRCRPTYRGGAGARLLGDRRRGRHLEQAKATAARDWSRRSQPLDLDVTVEAVRSRAALEGVATVVSCIDQPRRSLLHAAVERGLRYTDITPHLVELGSGAASKGIGAAARGSGARVVFWNGDRPRHLERDRSGRSLTHSAAPMSIETSLLLSASDASGPASFDYFVKELTMPFAVHVDGANRPAQAFSDPRVIEFPSPFGPRSAICSRSPIGCCIRGRLVLRRP